MEWLSSFGDDNSTQKGNSQKDKENQQIANRLKDSIQFLSDLFNVDIPEVQITEATELEPGSPSRQNNKLGNRLENQFNDSVDDFAEFDLDDENTDVTGWFFLMLDLGYEKTEFRVKKRLIFRAFLVGLGHFR